MAVYNHLLTFFSRYYEDGDFISQRRYKGDTYAIPYSGEEVLLHWANKDQYYTKSGENFSNYRFKLSDGREVFFRLTAADTAKDNRKDNDTARIFTLAEERVIKKEDDNGDIYEEAVYPVREVSDASGGKTLEIRFEYAAAPKGDRKPQEKANENTIATLKNLIGEDWQAVWQPAPTEKNPNRTLLEKHLADYTAKNTADYFIHKDLGRFLRRELDFYIKNEVMNLDNIQDAQIFANIENSLRQIQTLRTIAHELIDFLAQLEDFQKKLWLKKKFVAKSHWLITLNHIPKEMLKTVFANAEQREAWKNLFLIKELSSTDENLISFVELNPYLTVDTSLFPASFQTALLAALSNTLDLDEATDGLLIHSDNFQALNLLQARYREQVKCIYIDPPYNTGLDNEFIYKDSYQHSSWAALLSSRFELARNLIMDNSGVWVSTDDGEYANLKLLMEENFGRDNFVADVIWNSRKSVSNDALISVSTNHTTFFSKNKIALEANKTTFRIPESMDGFSNPDNDPRGLWKLDPMDAAEIRENLSYGITNSLTGEIFYPPEGRHWRFEEKDVKKYLEEGRILFGKTGKGRPVFKRFYEEAKEKGKTTKTLWDDVGTTTNGTQILYNLFKDKISKEKLNKFKPKPIGLIQKICQLHQSNDFVYLDYFAGSGTTAHAVINLNREDGGKRKYILVEMAEYFDTVLKPRVEKVVYAENWKDGKPVSSEKTSENNKNPFGGVPQIIKVLKLESYEDTLNNLVLKKQGELYEALPENVREDYLLRYMFDDQSREALLNTDIFKRPFNYQMDIATTSAGATERMNINLVETFNYLLGLRVSGIGGDVEKHGYLTVEGTLPDGEKTIVIWRDCDRLDYGGLNQLLERLKINPRDTEFDVVYINGDHNIPTIWETTDGERSILKIRPIESEFLTLMFEETE